MQVQGSGQALSGRDKAYAFVKEQVLTSAAAAGTFLNEQELATRIGVSRTPVREALLMLQAEGLVELVPMRGAQIPAMSGRQITELMDLRGVLERYAASCSLAAGTPPIQEMRRALAEQETLTDSDDAAASKKFIEWDGRFHQALIDAAGNKLLSNTYAGLRDRHHRVGLSALFASTDRQRNVCGEHQAIVDALESGDEDLVHAKIDEHLEITLQILLRA